MEHFSRFWPRILVTVSVTAGYAAFAWPWYLLWDDLTYAAIWLPSGYLAAAAVRFGPRAIGAIPFLAFVVLLWEGKPAILAAGYVLGDFLEAVCFCYLARALQVRTPEQSLRDAWWLMVISLISPCWSAGVAQTAGVLAGEVVDSATFWTNLLVWYQANICGLLVGQPFFQRLFAWRLAFPAMRQFMELLALAVVLLGLGWWTRAVFAHESASLIHYSLLFFPLPLWASVRLGPGWGSAVLIGYASYLWLLIHQQAAAGTLLPPRLNNLLEHQGLFLNLFLCLTAASTRLFTAALADSRQATHREDEQAELLRELFDTANVGLALIDDRQHILQTNHALRQILGQADADVLGRDWRKLVKVPPVDPTAGTLAKEPDSLLRAMNLSADALLATVDRPDGSCREVLVSTAGSGVRFISVTDISLLRQAYRELREQTDRMLSIAATTNDVIWSVTPGPEKFLFLSDSAAMVFGRPVNDFMREPRLLLSLFDPADQAVATRLFAGTLSVVRADIDLRMRRPDGQVRWMNWRWRPIYNHGNQLERLDGIASDCTDRRRVQERLQQRAKIEVLGRLAGSIAHDFNNILTIITGVTSMLRGQVPPNHPWQNDLEQLALANQRAADLVKQLLSFSRQRAAQPVPLRLEDYLRQHETMFRRLLPSNIELVMVVPDGLPALRIDPTHLTQVFMNLVANARDALPRGGVISIAVQRLSHDDRLTQSGVVNLAGLSSIRGESAGPHEVQAWLRIRVTDNGVGMPPEVQQHLFEPFFTTKEGDSGTGLGLATVYAIIRQAGGDIEIRSKVGEGTTCTIYLPAQPDTTPSSN